MLPFFGHLQLSLHFHAHLSVFIEFVGQLIDLQSELIYFAFVFFLLRKVLIFVALVHLLGLFEFAKQRIDAFVFDLYCSSEVVLLVGGQGR